jgi:hypothetical protein
MSKKSSKLPRNVSESGLYPSRQAIVHLADFPPAINAIRFFILTYGPFPLRSYLDGIHNTQPKEQAFTVKNKHHCQKIKQPLNSSIRKVIYAPVNNVLSELVTIDSQNKLKRYY